jgi:uncharacterized phage protein (TIGR02216 family)
MNWPALMAIGLGQMRLSPAVFWSMTPREFTAALGPQAADPMTRETLDTLTAQHPDMPHE